MKNTNAEADFQALQTSFCAHLESELRSRLAEKRHLTSGYAPQALPLLDALEDLVLARSKRLRPALVYFSYKACGGESEAAVLPLALAAELLHTYLLIHDDIMDRAPTRRGRPSAHARFAAEHRRHGWRGDAEHYGTSMAVLVGDLAHTWADELVTGVQVPAVAAQAKESRRGRALARRSLVGRSRAGKSKESSASGLVARRHALHHVYYQMSHEVIDGQYLEMHLGLELGGEGTAKDDVQLPDQALLNRVLRLKSGMYSVERPIELGALLAGAGEHRLSALARYGRAVGEAFQLQDDVLGLYGDPGATGKPVGGDLREGKYTFLIHHALQRLPAADGQRLLQALGCADLAPAQAEELAQLVRTCGGLAAVEEMIDDRCRRAAEALDGLDFTPAGKAFFHGLIAYVAGRDH